jgi:hypothetical protein
LPLPVFNRSNDLTEDRLPARSHAIARQEKSFRRGHEELFGEFGGLGMAGHVVLQLVARFFLTSYLLLTSPALT